MHILHIHNLLIWITVRLRRIIMNDPIVHAFCPVSLLLNIECDIGLIQGPGVRRGHGRILICGVRKEHRRILICGIRRGHGQILICCHHIHTNLHRGGHHAVCHAGLHSGHWRGHHAIHHASLHSGHCRGHHGGHHAGLNYVHHVPVIEVLLLKGCMFKLSINSLTTFLGSGGNEKL